MVRNFHQARRLPQTGVKVMYKFEDSNITILSEVYDCEEFLSLSPKKILEGIKLIGKLPTVPGKIIKAIPKLPEKTKKLVKAQISKLKSQGATNKDLWIALMVMLSMQGIPIPGIGVGAASAYIKIAVKIRKKLAEKKKKVSEMSWADIKFFIRGGNMANVNFSNNILAQQMQKECIKYLTDSGMEPRQAKMQAEQLYKTGQLRKWLADKHGESFEEKWGEFTPGQMEKIAIKQKSIVDNEGKSDKEAWAAAMSLYRRGQI